MKNELAFEHKEAALSVAATMLVDAHYVVMLSREESLWIVNYEYSDLCDRNDMVFMSREDFEEKYLAVEDFTPIGEEAQHD